MIERTLESTSTQLEIQKIDRKRSNCQIARNSSIAQSNLTRIYSNRKFEEKGFQSFFFCSQFQGCRWVTEGGFRLKNILKNIIN